MANQPPPPISPWSDLRWVLPAGEQASAWPRGPRAAPLRPIGQSMVGFGILIVLFTVYQLWGTGLVEWNAQRKLETQLTATLGSPDRPLTGQKPVATGGAGTRAADTAGAESAAVTQVLFGPPEELERITPAVARPVIPRPSDGQALARIELTTIGVSKVIVQGVGRDTLRKGPGHYPSTALPSENGNVAIAGHRTTHGAPFFDLDLLDPGDEITLETQDGLYRYEVQGHDNGQGGLQGHQIVDPSAVEVLADHGDNRLTLTACHPKYSARQRIVVSAILVSMPEAPAEPLGPSVPAATPPAGPRLPLTAADAVARRGETIALANAVGGDVPPAVAGPYAELATGDGRDDSLGWQRTELDPTTFWATIFLLMAFSCWIAGRLWANRAVYAASIPATLLPLAVFYYHLERLLPAF